jgi:hypothetical protein
MPSVGGNNARETRKKMSWFKKLKIGVHGRSYRQTEVFTICVAVQYG